MSDITAIPPVKPDPPARGMRSAKDPVSTVSRAFEAAFLAEMLKHAGLGRVDQTFGGGAGEAAFSDFLIREYASKIVRTRPLGIGEQVRKALAERVPE